MFPGIISLHYGDIMLILKGFKRFFADLHHNRTTLFAIILYISIAQFLFHSVCPIAIVFGFPCPACGLTRAGICFLTGHFRAAFHMNPCIYLVIPYFLYLWTFRYIFEKKPPHLTLLTVSLGVMVLGIYILRILTDTLPAVPASRFPFL